MKVVYYKMDEVLSDDVHVTEVNYWMHLLPMMMMITDGLRQDNMVI